MREEQTGDLSQLSMRDLFRMEADNQTQILTTGLLSLEQHAGDAESATSMMRAAHSIKGAAAIIGLDIGVRLAHSMEDVFVAVQHGLLQLLPDHVDALLAGTDMILQLSRLDDSNSDAWLADNAAQINNTIAAITSIKSAQNQPAPKKAEAKAIAPVIDKPAAATAPVAAPATPPTRNTAMSKAAAQNYDRLLSLASQSRINAHLMHPLIQSMQRLKRNQGNLFSVIEQLHDAISGTTIDPAIKEKATLALQKTQPLKQFMLEHLSEFETYERRLQTVSQGMIDEVLSLRMCPFRDGVQFFPRMVRDLSRSLGKEVELLIEGEDTLVDKDILSKIESPLNHMLRNSIDHGIEFPDERILMGKPSMGTIHLTAKHRGGMLDIEISDDGRGVDIERIRQSVIERKMLDANMAGALSESEVLEFLFLPAFSLKDTANEISGRGVGLDIVHDAIHQQNGSVKIESKTGLGFRILITLPLTQSIMRALIVDIKGEAYAIPIAKIERVIKLEQSAIHTLENKQFFDFGGAHVGLVSAAQLLGLGDMEAGATTLPVVVIGSGSRRYAIVVDHIHSEESLVVQSIESIFGKMRDISAAALLDDGTPVVILDVSDILLSIDKLLHTGSLHQLAQGNRAGSSKMKRVLVVDDSLTVREIERKLLLSRGFEVDIAVDGIDGWNLVRNGDYDLVITDVDMPRMDGIELVTQIKNDIRLHKLPVMIVSYKDRAEDRIRGLAAGADYYLTKGSFHDETLLDAVGDLIGDSRR